MADEEDIASVGSDLDELAATYGVAGEDDDGAAPGRVGALGGDLEGGMPSVEEDPDVVCAVGQGLDEAGLASALGDMSGGAASSSDAPPAAAPHQDLVPPAPVAPDATMMVGDPSASGYMHCEGRAIGRVQYGKPKNSVTINCYRHTNCRLLIAESRCPDLLALKRWLLEVEPAAPGASKAERLEVAKLHMASGRSQWFAPKKRPA